MVKHRGSVLSDIHLIVRVWLFVLILNDGYAVLSDHSDIINTLLQWIFIFLLKNFVHPENVSNGLFGVFKRHLVAAVRDNLDILAFVVIRETFHHFYNVFGVHPVFVTVQEHIVILLN